MVELLSTAAQRNILRNKQARYVGENVVLMSLAFRTFVHKVS